MLISICQKNNNSATHIFQKFNERSINEGLVIHFRSLPWKKVLLEYLTEKVQIKYTVEPLLRGHPDERPPPLERPLHNVNLNINVLISTPNERPPHLKGHFSDAKGVASQEGFHCNSDTLSKEAGLSCCSCYM